MRLLEGEEVLGITPLGGSGVLDKGADAVVNAERTARFVAVVLEGIDSGEGRVFGDLIERRAVVHVIVVDVHSVSRMIGARLTSLKGQPRTEPQAPLRIV